LTDQNPRDKKLREDIESYGWQVVKVMEDDKGPGFCYSIGLYQTFRHPEIIILGLKPDLGHVLINNIGEDIKNGKTYQAGQFYRDILVDYKCFMLNASAEYFDEYLGCAQSFYQAKDFPLLQCVYPTLKGIYPWENDWPKEIRDLQPLLGEIDPRKIG